MDIDRIAELSRLALTEAERARYAKDLDSILGHFERLQAADTSDVPPAVSAVALAPRERDDIPRESPPVDVLLEGAPARQDDLYEVPRVIAAE